MFVSILSMMVKEYTYIHPPQGLVLLMRLRYLGLDQLFSRSLNFCFLLNEFGCKKRKVWLVSVNKQESEDFWLIFRLDLGSESNNNNNKSKSSQLEFSNLADDDANWSWWAIIH